MLKQWYQNLSIRLKIIAFYLPLSLLPLLIFAVISRNTYINTITSRTLDTATDNSHLIINKIESIMTNTEDCADMLSININEAIKKNNEDLSTSQLGLHTDITSQLSYALMIFSNIDSLVFIDTNNVIYYTNPNLISNSNVIDYSRIINTLDKTSGTNYWFEMQNRSYLVTDEMIPVLSLGKKIIDIQTGKTLGYIIINIKETTLSTIFNTQNTLFFIVDDNDTIISSNDMNTILTSYMEHPLYMSASSDEISSKVLQVDGSKTLITVMTFSKKPWKLISKANLSDLAKDIDQTNLLVIISIIFIIIFQIISSHMLSSIITNPIIKIASGMKEIGKGNFEITFSNTSNDEIGFVAESFNHMTTEIKNLLDKIHVEQRKKRKYELALFQEHIKPHFLYNCLDTIYTLSIMERNKDAAKATKALADYYRLSLSKGENIISINDEINSVKDYLELQQIRYSDIFTYTIDIDENMLSYKILKLTLQPIVENAIYHGLKNLDNMGEITISNKETKDEIIIIIADTGIGMSKDKLNNLFIHSIKQNHFGLYNVQDRIQLFFGKSYGLTIESTENIGTTVEIRLPKIIDINEV